MRSKFFFYFLIFLAVSSYSQVNIMGKPGYMVTPSADWIEGKSLGISHSYFPKKYSKTILNHSYTSVEGNNLNFFNLRLELTSFLEVNFNIVRSIDADRKIGIGERHLDVRFRIMKENKHRPSIVLGLTPPGSSAPYLSHDYLVISKELFTTIGVFKVNMGYGSPYLVQFSANNISLNRNNISKKKDAFGNEYLSGFFGGLSYSPYHFIGIMAEYDSQNINSGLYINIKDILFVQGYFVNGDRPAINMAMNFSLDFSPKALRKHEKSLD